MAVEQSRANWQPDNSRKIVGRYVIEGDLILDTPTHFGNGETNGTEMVILEVAGQPLLPGASIAGALRHYLQRVDAGYRTAETEVSLAVELFGTAYDNDEGEQSRVIVDDAISDNAHLIARDGVKIDGATGIADEGQLFNIQLWNRGAVFPIRVEMLIYQDDNEHNKLLSGLMTALSGFDKHEIPMGARKSRGYGECHVEQWRVRYYDFTQVNDVVAWVRDGGQSLTQLNVEPVANLSDIYDGGWIDDSRQFVRIEATFTLVDTLLIRSLSDVADTAHLVYEDGTPVLSGTSVAGALRARARKIAKTFVGDQAHILIDDMFGRHGEDQADSDNEDYGASRLMVKERAIIDPDRKTMQQVQNRVKIDRFTGGAFETALIAQQPVFALDDTRVEVCLELQYPDDDTDNLLLTETGLLLLLLKDLWTGDLPLGGERSIGRGRLSGLHADVTVKTKDNTMQYQLSADEPFDRNVQSALEMYVSAFADWTRGGA